MPPRASLKSDPLRAVAPQRQMFVLLQTLPRLEVVATSHDRARLAAERDVMLGMPWDQDAHGARELLIAPAIHLAPATHDRQSFQRRDRLR